MKIEHLVARYLFSHKQLSLQEIGRFRIAADIVIPAEQDKEFVLPENAVQFEYDPRAVQDDAFIGFIMEQTRKIKPLATSDLESFTMLGKQFMNIGKPLMLEGLGMLFKNQSGQYEFKQGDSFQTRTEQLPQTLKEKEKSEIDFSSPVRKQQNYKWLAGLLVVLIAGTLVYVFYTLRSKDGKEKEIAVTTAADSLSKPAQDSVPAPQTSQPVTDSTAPAKNPADSFTFKIVIREYDNQALADKKLDQFKTYGHKLVQVKKDSNLIFLAMPFMRPLADSGKMKDSLKVLFGGSPKVIN